MNNAEHIRARVRDLAERDQITRMQLVEIIEGLVAPYVDPTISSEPRHFGTVNTRLHRIIRAADLK